MDSDRGSADLPSEKRTASIRSNDLHRRKARNRETRGHGPQIVDGGIFTSPQRGTIAAFQPKNKSGSNWTDWGLFLLFTGLAVGVTFYALP